MVPLYKCQLYHSHIHLEIINALEHFVPLLFWGISLLQIASYLFNFFNYQHLQKYCAKLCQIFGGTGVTISEYLILQNLRVMRHQLHSYTKLCDLFYANEVFKQPMEPLVEGNFTTGLHMGAPACHEKTQPAMKRPSLCRCKSSR